MSIERKPGPKRLPEQDFRESYKEKETGTADERGFLVKLGVPRFAELADESFERKPQRKALYFTGDNSFGKLEVTQHSKCVGKGETMKIKVVVHKAEEGGYWAEVPAIPGCATQGDTLEELLENLYEAIEGCLSVDLEQSKSTGKDRILEIAI